MQSSNQLDIYRYLTTNNIKFIDYTLLQKISGVDNSNSLYKLASRLEQSGILQSLNKAGKYLVVDSNANQFEIANYLYQPSYVSLESALSFYGILSQFSYTVSSITIKQTKKTVFSNQEFNYSQISNNLFWGYQKIDGFLIATKEKALLDSLYFVEKGIIYLDTDNLDLSDIDQNLLDEYRKKFKNK